MRSTISAISGALLLALSTVSGTARADHQGTVNVGKGHFLNVRGAPNTDSEVIGKLPDQAKVTIICTLYGESVTGTYGTSSVWDVISTGGCVADAYVYTGSNKPVEPECDHD